MTCVLHKFERGSPVREESPYIQSADQILHCQSEHFASVIAVQNGAEGNRSALVAKYRTILDHFAALCFFLKSQAYEPTRVVRFAAD